MNNLWITLKIKNDGNNTDEQYLKNVNILMNQTYMQILSPLNTIIDKILLNWVTHLQINDNKSKHWNI